MLLKTAILVAVIICIAVPATQANNDESLTENKYLIMAPKVMVSETTETVCIQLMNMTEPIYISVKLMDGDEELKRIPLYFMDFPYVCLQIEVPKVSRVERFAATLLVSAFDYDEIKQLFTTSKKIYVEPRNSKTFIQTDKPIYKPGQTVKFRILTLDQNLRPKLDMIEKVYIEAPNGVRLSQWINVTTQDGLSELEFELTSEPQLGTWIITAVINNLKTTQEFDVDEYVLPKFEVKIKSPSFILINETQFNIKVCGRYTYGQPVFGRIRADVLLKSQNYYSRNSPTFATLYKESDTTGCAEFLINTEIFDLQRYRYSYSKIHVTGHVMEQGTGIELNGIDDTGIVARSPMTIRFDAVETFKPGLPFFGKIFVTKPDEVVSPNTEVSVIATANYGVIFDEMMTTDSNGLIAFTLSNITIKASRISIKAEIFGYTPERNCNDWYCGNYILNPRGSLYARASYSPSGSFLQLQPILKTLNAGDKQTITLRYTWDSEQGSNPDDVRFQFLFMSRGNILQTEPSYLPTFEQSPSAESQPASPEEQEVTATFATDLQDEEFEVVEEVVEKVVIEDALLEFNSTDIEYIDWYPFYPVPTVKIAEPGKMYLQRMQFEVTQEMAPVTGILIYYVRLDGEVVADSIQVNVDNQFENKVDISFTENKKKPGEATLLKITSAADSLCAVGVVDKSVHLLRSNNQLTPEKVFSTLDDYQLSSDGGYIERSDRCPYENWYRKKRSINKKRRSIVAYPSQSDYEDSSKAFENMGLVFMTNIDVETRPCFIHPFAVAMMSIAGGVPELEVNLLTPLPGPSIRSYFPETWLWDLKRQSESGELLMNVTVPDTITEWVGSGFCTSVSKGVGVSSTTRLQAFQPFFVSYALPYSVIRGEKVAIKTTIFNYLESCLAIKVRFEKTEDFDLFSAATQFVCVCGGQSTTLEFSIVPKALGKIPLTMFAESVSSNSGTAVCPADSVMSDLLSVGDAIKKELLVEPEGIRKEVSYTELLNVDDSIGVSFEKPLLASLPSNFIAGSESGHLTLIGDLMGKTLANLDKLLRMPTGCGEQNMLGFVPNIYVLQYLNKTGQVDPIIEQKALRYMKIGYQRELNYRRADSSYSAFGNSDPAGSTWLTAFVVKSFAQASKYIFVDQKDLDVSINWLKSLQMESGCFRSVGKVIHSSMQGGVDNAQTLTAYTMIAMMESGISNDDLIIRNAIQCVSNNINYLYDPYNIALMAYALTLAGAPRQDDIIQHLNEKSIDEDGMKHWDAFAPDTTSYYYIPEDKVATARDVEATAYGLLALLSSTDVKNDQITLGLPIVQWITRQTNPQGGYISTQDTVMALQALATFAGVGFSNRADLYLDVQVQGDRQPTRFYVTANNRLVVQRMSFQLQNPFTAIFLNAGGIGTAVVQTVIRYNVPSVYLRPSFEVLVDVDQEEGQDLDRGCGRQVMDICTTYNGTARATSMAVVEVQMPSGYYPDKTSLRSLTKFNPFGIKRYDIDGKVVSIYFDEFIRNVEVCFKLIIDQHELVEDLKPATVFVYDYYDTVQQGRSFYEVDCTDEETELVETLPSLELVDLIFRVRPLVVEALPIDAFLNVCPEGKKFADGVKKCVDINECEQPDICPKKKVCINTNGSYKCKKACAPGFKREGKRCVDINECEVNPNTCAEGFICKNIKGDRLCEKASEVCEMEKVVGPCRAQIPRWYWNKESKQCERFDYGGCRGNENNFQTIEACERKCQPQPPAHCLLPVDSGVCLAAFSMFYYDMETKQCRSFIYGGCRGNGNRFNTYKDCQETCFARKKDDTEKPGICPISEDGICVEHCSVDSDCEGVAKCCSNGCGHLCSRPACEPGYTFLVDRCIVTVICDPGFENVNGQCVDINECETVANACPQDIGCINTEGSYECGGGNPFIPPVWVVKDGSCPLISGDTVGICVQLCDVDDDCDNTKKCCSNGCGRECMEPVVLTHCQERQARGGLLLLGAFNPKCDENGEYIAAQCHPSTGFCFCVDEVGEIIEETRQDVRGVKPNCDEIVGVEPEICPPLCRMYCEFGNILDDNGCPICECIQGPIIQVNVTVICDPGFENVNGQCVDINECHIINSCPQDVGCKNTEGSFECIYDGSNPFVPPELELILVKEGSCPLISGDTVGICVQSCDVDDDCDNTKKCCSNGCGRECMEPVVLTHCQERQARGGLLLLGAFNPKCDENGEYIAAQCHPSTGFCFCVDEVGEIIEETRQDVRGVKPNCDEIVGVEPVICPPLCRMYCEFGNVLDDIGCPICECIQGPIVQLNVTVICDSGFENVNGHCVDINECHIINSCPQDVGCKNTEGSFECIYDGSNPFVPPEFELILIKEGSCPVISGDTVGICVQSCDVDNDCDDTKKCCSNGCGHECMEPVEPCPAVCLIYCEFGNVLDDNGCPTCECIEGTEVPDIVVELTHCQQTRKDYIDSGLIGGFLPSCNDDGSYVVSQCHGGTGFCFCIDEFGEVIEETRMQVRGVEADCSQYLPEKEIQLTHCQNRQVQAEADKEARGGRPLLGAFIPKCDENGEYIAAQCHPSTGFCFCVDEVGEIIEETRQDVRGVKPNCDEIVVVEPEICPPLCKMYCEFGNVLDDNGCPICECIQGPVIQVTVSVTCDEGFENVDGQCVDINECETVVNACPQDSGCKNTEGSFECVGGNPFKPPVWIVKDGSCPLISGDTVGICVQSCDVDNDCDDTKKCCSNGCGRVCVEPVVLTHCQERQARGGLLLLGAFIPKCDENGEYIAAQCHPSTGFCFCVDEVGEIIEETRQNRRGVKPNCDEIVVVEPEICPPLCRMYCEFGNVLDDNGCPICECIQGPIIQVNVSVTCDEGFENVDGQCVDINECETVVNACPQDSGCKNTEGSFECVGGNPFKPPVWVVKDGSCPLISGDTVGICVQLCDVDNDCDNTKKCCSNGCGRECVEPVVLTHCQERQARGGLLLLGAFNPKCDENGEYIAAQCHPSTGFCFCVDEVGEIIEETRQDVRGVKPNCDEIVVEPEICPPLCRMFCEFGNVLDDNGCPICECIQGTIIPVTVSVTCDEGFENVDGQCVDFNECETVSNACPQDSGCKNTEGSYECVGGNPFIPPGLIVKDGSCPLISGDTVGICVQSCDVDDDCDNTKKCCSNGCGRECVEPVEPEICPPLCRMYCEFGNVLDDNGCPICECIQGTIIPVTVSVTCDKGFENVNEQCVDINECETVVNACPQDSGCINTEGSFECVGGNPFIPPVWVVKDGSCPLISGDTVGICVQLCDVDDDCDNTKKCCSNGCGRACMEPVVLTHCQERQARGGLLLLGAFNPKCDENGEYIAAQCHPSTGFCFCVDEVGEIIEETRQDVRGVKPNCDEIVGVEPVICPPLCRMYCEFGNVLDDIGCPICECIQGPIVQLNVTVICDSGFENVNGHCVDINECHIINSCPQDVGCKNTEGSFECIYDGSNPFVPPEFELILIKEGSCPVISGDTVGICVQSCDVDNDCDDTKKCCSNGCGHECMEPVEPCPAVCLIYCEFGNVLDDNGCPTCECIEGTEVPDIVVELTHCQQTRKDYIDSGLIGGFLPSCNDDGSYVVSQCHGGTGFCFCIDEFGEVIEETRMQVRGVEADCSQYLPEKEIPIDCEGGYVYDSVDNLCQDVDECQQIDSCSSSSRCVNLPGTYECECLEGYIADSNNQCIDVDECLIPDLCGIVPVGNCVNTVGSYQCDCFEGFTTDEYGNCQDIDECLQPRCGINFALHCVNTWGSFRCECSDGFTTDPEGGCEDIDECADSSQCSGNSVCSNTYGAYRCDCNQGYVKNFNGHCVVNEVRAGDCPSSSGLLAVCTNMCKIDSDCFGDTKCCSNGCGQVCLPAVLSVPDTTEEDIDECEQTDLCDSSSRCVNLPGTYECECLEGYIADSNNQCIDVNECLVPDQCVFALLGNCVNTVGSFECVCSDGYTKDDDGYCQAEDCPVCAADTLPDDFVQRVCAADFVWSAKLKKDGSTFRLLRNQSMEKPAPVPEGMNELLTFTASSSCLQQCELLASFQTYDKFVIITKSSLIANSRIELDGETMIIDLNGENRKDLMKALKSCDRM